MKTSTFPLFTTVPFGFSGWFSHEASLLGLQAAVCSLCPHKAFSLWACLPGVSPSSCEDASHTGLGPIQMTSFNLNYLCEGPLYKYSLRYTGG